MSSRRAVKAVAGTGVLAVLALATGGVVAHGLAEQQATAAADAAATTVTADVPLLNPALDAEDLVHVSPASRSTAREALLASEGVTFSVVVDGGTRELTTAAATLGDALAEAGIALGWEDEVSADLTAAPEAGAQVTIARTATTYVTEQSLTPHPVEQRETDELAVGETRVVQEGVDGDATVTSEVRLVDGVEVARTTVLTAQATASVPEIVEVGTRELPTSTKLYTLRQFMSAGVVNWGGYRFTYYSQSVLPGGGLAIPGRHINADGYVADADGYIVLANSSAKGTIIDTPFGYQGKVYDRGTVGNHYDVYTQ
ncbi:hypothetical protein C8046_13560 [Serinibacter arcticus]|uniref:G5 domain-containing protein n=1 Tax=Serinibacter arcticus TaxID=1655435 RepID=A0A2U1ZX56_9MICO|nr:G5 domain-containing protein [Serinibacter arcticus]PWD51530.1 hypothetical protein C8046_13560 [Serinibacter arcticus]